MRSTAARRLRILEILCRRRFETIGNLMSEFGVSRRTIQYDIELLSVSAPIYTIRGKGGGVYVIDGWNMETRYLSEKQASFLISLKDRVSIEEREILDSILQSFSCRFDGNKR